MTALRAAFKEWAVVCKALDEGRQALILRKGGVAEPGGTFRAEHSRFWLFPTYVHQDPAGLLPDARELFEQGLKERPPEGILRLRNFVEVAGIYQLRDLVGAWKLTGMHVWSHEAVRSRFEYRTPGLNVLAVRVWRAEQPIDLPDLPEYAGCKSWVELKSPPDARGTPVLGDGAFREYLNRIETLLQPTAVV